MYNRRDFNDALRASFEAFAYSMWHTLFSTNILPSPLCATQCMKKHVKMMKKVIDVIPDWYQTQNNNLYWPSMLFWFQPIWFRFILSRDITFEFGYEIKEKYSFRGCPFYLSRKMLLYQPEFRKQKIYLLFLRQKAKSK